MSLSPGFIPSPGIPDIGSHSAGIQIEYNLLVIIFNPLSLVKEHKISIIGKMYVFIIFLLF